MSLDRARLGGWACALAMIASAGSALAQEAADKPQNPVTGAVSQPFRDLSLVRDVVPATLIRAAEAPYDLTEASDCAALTARIDELDRLLGPDVDVPADKRKDGDDIIGSLLKGAFGLPFRGVVRRVTGAERRDRAKARAVLAGMARRSFLKGVSLERRCPGPPPAALPASAPPAAG